MVKHRRSTRRSAHRKSSRSAHRKSRRFQQRGGDGYGYTGPAFAPSATMAPVESRVDFSHCGFMPRPGSLVGGARHRKSHRKSRRSQHGGGGGTGGYGFDITSNSMGKEYAALSVGSCPPPIRPGAQMGGANMMDVRAIDSYSAGYGYNPSSAVEVGDGTAHYLNQIPYGRQCMGGGRRKTNKKSRKSRK